MWDLTVSVPDHCFSFYLMRRNMCFRAAIIERLTDSTGTRINAAHVIVEIIAG